MSEQKNQTVCQAKRGFFTLYDCGKASVSECTGCGRALCAEHFPEKLPACLECEAKRQPALQFSTSESHNKQVESPYHDLLTAYSLRNTSLEKADSALYLGQTLGDYYQSYDLRSFDIELSNIADLADSPDEIFFDS